MKKHRITKLVLREISGVDNPAQPGATVLLMKRADPPKENGQQEQPMFKTREELLAAIQKFQTQGGTVAEMQTIRKSATELKAEDALPKDGVFAPEAGTTAPPVTDPALVERVEKAEKIAAFTAVEKAHYDTLDAAGKTAFLAKSTEARTQEIDLAKGDDPVVYTCDDGTLLRKSAGEHVIALAKRADTSARELAIEKAARIDADLEKRAGDLIPKLTGDMATHKALLKAVDGIADQATRDKVIAVLKAANTAAAGTFTPTGEAGHGHEITKAADDPEAELDTLAKNFQTANPNTTYSAAYDAVLSTPRGAELYKQSLNKAA